ncbi:MAG TPA: cytochrome c oxidase subunit II [Rhodocyclaceae bacterium]|nr:cytochrome c oxidase subunit II [Rhodocyclaceae bacterium]
MNDTAPYAATDAGSQAFQLLAQSASAFGNQTDRMFLAMLLLCGCVALALVVVIVYFSIRYRSGSKADRSNPPDGARGLEAIWTATPLLLFVCIFVWAARGYVQLYRPPDNAMTIFVVAKQWMWKLQHRNGRREINELHLPLGQPVRLVMTSQDVIHSLFLPAFRIKQDVVPGRYTSIWVTPDRTGDFRLMCSEFCGSDHAGMLGRVIVMKPAEFTRWLDAGAQEPGLAAQGFALFRQHGCSGCHDSSNGSSTVRAPDLNGLLGRSVHLQDGRTVIADDVYVRDSILLPSKDVVAGYAPVMPSFAGQLSEDDIFALIAYLRSTTERGSDVQLSQ